MAGAAGLVCGKIFDVWFPINKKLWTSSYVIFTAGFALVCLALCYWVVDVRKYRARWMTPFQIFGMNAIAGFVLSEAIGSAGDSTYAALWNGAISPQPYIYERFFAPLASPPNASLLFALVIVMVCFLAMWLLYRKRIFLKV